MKKSIQIFLFFLFATNNCNPQTWDNVGGGLKKGTDAGNIKTMSIFNNELYVSGSFDNFNGNPVGCNIAKWNGSAWSSLGLGIYCGIGMVNDFKVYKNELYAGGDFNSIGGCSFFSSKIANTNSIAKWDGTNWHSANNYEAIDLRINALEVYNDYLYAGGNLTMMWSSNGDTLKLHRIAKYDGTSWSDVGGGVRGGFESISTMIVYKNELYIAGDFSIAGDTLANNIARWDGTKWKPCGSGISGYIGSMVVDTINNLLYVGGSFSNAGGVETLSIAIWDGEQWFKTNSWHTGGIAIEMYNNSLFVGSQPGSTSITDTALTKFDGTDWSVIYGTNSTIFSLKTYKDRLYVGGYFTKAGGLDVNGIVSYYELPVNIQEVIDSTQLNIFPNPSDRNIIIETTQKAEKTLKIYNLAGMLIKEIQVSKLELQTNVNISNWEKGVYVCELYIENNKIESCKFVVK